VEWSSSSFLWDVVEFVLLRYAWGTYLAQFTSRSTFPIAPFALCCAAAGEKRMGREKEPPLFTLESMRERAVFFLPNEKSTLKWSAKIITLSALCALSHLNSFDAEARRAT
jgi:hypothetical protein